VLVTVGMVPVGCCPIGLAFADPIRIKALRMIKHKMENIGRIHRYFIETPYYLVKLNGKGIIIQGEKIAK
jgi:hypothetical protein